MIRVPSTKQKMKKLPLSITDGVREDGLSMKFVILITVFLQVSQ